MNPAADDRFETLAELSLSVPSEAALTQLGTHCEVAARDARLLVADLDDHLACAPGGEGIRGWLTAANGWAQECDRLAVLRWLELWKLQARDVAPWERQFDPPTPLEGKKRPLRLLEIALLRWACRDDIINGLPVAMLEATATSGEIGAPDSWIRPDLNRGGFVVDLPGCRRAAPRTGRLPVWSNRLLADEVDEVGVSARQLMYSGQSTDADDIASAVLMRVRKVLDRVGLAGSQYITPESVRLTAGRTLRDQHGLEAAAEALGGGNLERLRRTFAYQ